jgi:hypothetical protein
MEEEIKNKIKNKKKRVVLYRQKSIYLFKNEPERRYNQTMKMMHLGIKACLSSKINPLLREIISSTCWKLVHSILVTFFLMI